MTSLNLFLFTILLFLVVSLGLRYFSLLSKREYYRNYMRKYRERKSKESYRLFRKWQAHAIKVKNLLGEDYLILR